MTDKDKLEIAREVARLLKEQSAQVKVCPKDVLAPVRAKWFSGPNGYVRKGKLSDAIGEDSMFQAWEHIKRLVCHTLGARVVYDIVDSTTAIELGNALCQTIYDYHIKAMERTQAAISRSETGK